MKSAVPFGMVLLVLVGCGSSDSGGSDPTTVTAGDGIATTPVTGGYEIAVDSSVSRLGHMHDGGDVTTGTIAIGRLPTGTGGAQVALGNHGHSNYANLVHSHAVADLPLGTTAISVAAGDHTHAATFNGVGFLAYNSAERAYANGWQTMVLDSEAFDHGGVYNTTTGWFVAPYAGVYSFSACVNFHNVDAGTDISFYLSAASAYIANARVISPGTGWQGTCLSATHLMAAGSGARLEYSTSDTAWSIYGNSVSPYYFTQFSGHLVYRTN